MYKSSSYGWTKSRAYWAIHGVLKITILFLPNRIILVVLIL